MMGAVGGQAVRLVPLRQAVKVVPLKAGVVVLRSQPQRPAASGMEPGMVQGFCK
jgi:hypothetical protein